MGKIDNALKKLLETNPLSLSTVGKNNCPHTIYVTYAKVEGDKITITDNFMEKTKANILQNPNVSLSILIGEAGFELIGTAEYFSSGKLVEFIRSLPENKAFPCKGAVVVSVSNVKKMG